MYVRCIRSWHVRGHIHCSLCPLSALKRFTLERLNVSYVCTRTAVVTGLPAVAGNRLNSSTGRSNALGLLWRSVAAAYRFVPRRNRKIYWGYVVLPDNGIVVK